jgi:unsaturated rhamnogalacturonyl hydrolase
MKTLDIARNLYIRYGQVEEIKHYYGLLALYGLCQIAYESKAQDLIKSCNAILGRYPDHFDHPYYNFECYRLGGNAKAWSMMMGLVDKDKVLLKTYADKTLNGCADKDGILCLPGTEDKGLIWIDVVAAVTPFMLYAGIVLENDTYIDFAVDQCIKMYEVFIDKTCGLLHQSRGFREGIKSLSEDHWSRGNGWGYIGLTELVKYLPANSPHRSKVETYYLEMSNSILKYQTDKGLWRQEMTEPLSWEESSGSAIFVYGLGAGIRLGLLKEDSFKNGFKQGIYGLINYCINSDFSTELSCPGCLCPGEGANKGTIQAYITEKLPVRNEHHSFGAFMLAMVEAHRNGIKEVDWKMEGVR